MTNGIGDHKKELCNMQDEVYFSFVNFSQVTSVGRCGPMVQYRSETILGERWDVASHWSVRPGAGLWLAGYVLSGWRLDGAWGWLAGLSIDLVPRCLCPPLSAVLASSRCFRPFPELQSSLTTQHTPRRRQWHRWPLPSPETKWKHEGIYNPGFEEVENEESKSDWHFFLKDHTWDANTPPYDKRCVKIIDKWQWQHYPIV